MISGVEEQAFPVILVCSKITQTTRTRGHEITKPQTRRRRRRRKVEEGRREKGTEVRMVM